MEENSTLRTPAKNEVMIVEALSTIELPESVIGESKINYLVSEILAANATLADRGRRLDKARQEKNAGNAIGNWWHGRDERVQGAQLDLNRSIGALTQKSSQLLMLNTAISKYLTYQQRTLLEQQDMLKQQAEKIERQNVDILHQQKALAQQQREISAANQGLLEAKGISQEQAQKLVGCVKRVSEAESKMETAGRELMAAVERKLEETVGKCIGSLNEGFGIIGTRHEDLRREVNGAVSVLSFSTKGQFDQITNTNARFVANLEQRLQTHVDDALQRASAQDSAAHQLRDDLRSWLDTVQHDFLAALDGRVQTLHQFVGEIDAKYVSGHLVHEKMLVEQSMMLRDLTINLARVETNHFRTMRQNRMALIGVMMALFATIGWQTVQYLTR